MKKVMKSFIDKNIDGIILCPGNDYGAESYRHLKDLVLTSPIPVVVFGLPLGKELSTVYVDLTKAQYQLTMHLLQKNLTDIVFFGGESKYTYS